MPTNSDKINALLLGSGGREHALAAAISRSPRLGALYATGTSNPGIAALAKPVGVPVDIKQIYRLNQFCDKNNIAFVIIGPEDPLAEGYADALSIGTTGKPRVVFGPSKAAARLEADKAFAKQLMRQASIPTADGRVFTDADAACDFLSTRDEDHVVKAAGLAKGKGVIVPASTEQGLDAIDRIMRQRVFGDAGDKVLIEERMHGTEVSVLALCDGRNILVLPPCQDHKRLADNDAGPNTGGMGAFCPSTAIDDDTMAIVERDILVPTVDAMRREGVEFRGVLYAGLMLTPAGPKVLEFNVRFGDPECQPLMARLDSDALELLLATAQGTLDEVDIRFTEDAAVTVVLASHGYPESPRTGDVISGLDAAANMPGVTIHHAGTKRAGSDIVTAGGRVLGVTALGPTLSEARDRAYAAADLISFAGMQLRRDIAAGVNAHA